MNANEQVSAEQWLSVAGFEGLYSVSDLGRVRSLDRIDRQGRLRKGRILRPAVRRDGHLHVGLCRDSKRVWRYVHVLVAEAFHGQRPDGMEVRHLNGNPADNRAENLAFGSHSENQFDSVAHGTHRNARKTRCINGHELDLLNTRWKPDGSRVCRACDRIHCERYRARKAAKIDSGRAVAA